MTHFILWLYHPFLPCELKLSSHSLTWKSKNSFSGSRIINHCIVPHRLAHKKNSQHPSMMLIVIFKCEISHVTSVPKFWWPQVSMRQAVCVYRWGAGTCHQSFEMWQGESNDEIISDLRVTVAFRGGSPARSSPAWLLAIHVAKVNQLL